LLYFLPKNTYLDFRETIGNRSTHLSIQELFGVGCFLFQIQKAPTKLLTLAEALNSSID